MDFRYLLLIPFSLILFSCGPKERPVLFSVAGTNRTLVALSREAAEGRLDVSGRKKLEYRFASALSFSAPASMEIEYVLTGDLRPVLEGAPLIEGGTQSWLLPKNGDFGENIGGRILHYAVPIGNSFPEYFSIAPASGVYDKHSGTNRDVMRNIMQIHSIRFSTLWYGLYDREELLFATPFVSRGSDDSWVIAPPGIPAGWVTELFPEFTARGILGKGMIVDAGSRRFEASPRLDWLAIPAGIIDPDLSALVLSGDNDVSFSLSYASLSDPVFITADPGMVLEWPVERWRDRRYEVFVWDRFRSLLIFDTADYEVQNRMFKRLAFFVEKTGFRGRLVHDEEIADLHGWNAHDYRAEDLARFFQRVRETNFPLHAEERELENFLRTAGIIIDSVSGIQAGKGGVISISRESADYLRYRFMAHEGYHGLFFIDEDFRAFTRDRWQQLSPEAKRFIVSFFGFQQYDTADEYLLVNEFMAHVLQQPVSQAGRYFGQTLPASMENSWRKAHLPAKDEASNSWPSLAAAFTREAEAFSAYVNTRWGLAAGRVHLITVRQ
jgi:hypothetical protein